MSLISLLNGLNIKKQSIYEETLFHLVFNPEYKRTKSSASFLQSYTL